MSAVTADERAAPVSERPAPNPPRKRWTRFILPVYSILIILYLTSPVLTMILYGFNDIPGERQTPKFWGFTLHWYRDLFGVPGLTPAFKHSIFIAIPSAIVATILGTFIGLALGRYTFKGRAPTNFVIFLAIAVPEIVLGSSLLAMFVLIEAPLGYGSIFVSHVGFSIAFVAVTVRARVQGLDRSLEDAAQDLFANPVTAFFKVTLPLIAPGIVAGGLLAFVLSLDDFVITNFVSGQFQTFPIWVYGATRIGLPPQVNVMGTLLFMTGVVFAVANVALQRRRAVA
jgi:spermidine/putrescine transport system permease protein